MSNWEGNLLMVCKTSIFEQHGCVMLYLVLVSLAQKEKQVLGVVLLWLPLGL